MPEAMNFTNFTPHYPKILYANLVEIGLVILEKNLKLYKSLRATYDERRRKKQIQIGHLNDSGNLKKRNRWLMQ